MRKCWPNWPTPFCFPARHCDAQSCARLSNCFGPCAYFYLQEYALLANLACAPLHACCSISEVHMCVPISAFLAPCVHSVHVHVCVHVCTRVCVCACVRSGGGNSSFGLLTTHTSDSSNGDLDPLYASASQASCSQPLTPRQSSAPLHASNGNHSRSNSHPTLTLRTASMHSLSHPHTQQLQPPHSSPQTQPQLRRAPSPLLRKITTHTQQHSTDTSTTTITEGGMDSGSVHRIINDVSSRPKEADGGGSCAEGVPVAVNNPSRNTSACSVTWAELPGVQSLPAASPTETSQGPQANEQQQQQQQLSCGLSRFK